MYKFSENLISIIPDKIVATTIYSSMCSRNPRVQEVAFKRVANMEHDLAIKFLLKGIKNRNRDVYEWSVIKLPRVLDRNDEKTSIIPVLIDCLKNENEPEIIVKIIDSLTLFGKEVIPYLEKIDSKIENLDRDYKHNIYMNIVARIRARKKKYIQFLIDYMNLLDKSSPFYKAELRQTYAALRLYYNSLGSKRETFGLDIEEWTKWWEQEKKKDIYN